MSTVGRRLAALVAVLSLVVVGCGGVGGGGDDKPQGDANGTVSGTLSTFGFSLPDEIATTRVDTFKKAYPQVQVKITEGGFDEQQFLSAVASGSPPDLVYVDREIIGTYAARGAIQPLDDCISKASIDMSQYRPAAVKQVTVGGKVYGIPEFYSVRVMMINNQAVKEAGLSPADLPARQLSVHPAPRPQGDPRPVKPGRRAAVGGGAGRQRHRHRPHAGHLLSRPALLRRGDCHHRPEGLTGW
jgi:multiple sugar transport system substrate-binding protein